MKHLFALLFLVSCAPAPYKVNQYHEDRKVEKAYFKDKKLFIAPLLMEVTSVSNGSAMLDSGKESLYISKDSLGKVFNHNLVSRFEREYRDVQLIKEMPETGKYNAALTSDKLLESVNFYDNNNKVEYYFKHPKKEALEALGIRTDLILFISGMAIQIRDIEVGQSGGGGGMMMTPGAVSVGPKGPVMGMQMTGGGGGFGPAKKVPRMNAFAKYIIWDYIKDAPVAYGQFQLESGVDEDKIQARWKDIQETVTNRIVLNSGKLR